MSEEASALAVARAHERMLQADLAQAQAAAEQPRGAAGAERTNARQRTAAAGSQAASRSQAQQLQALSRAEQVARTLLKSNLGKNRLHALMSCALRHPVLVIALGG